MSPGLVKLLVAVALLTVLAVGTYAAVSSYNGAIERAQRLEGENTGLRKDLSDQITENGQIRDRQARTDTLLATREAERRTTATIEGKIDAALAKVYSGSKEARDWGAQRVPGALVNSLRAPGPAADKDKNGSGVPAGKPAAGQPDTGVAGGTDQRGAAVAR